MSHDSLSSDGEHKYDILRFNAEVNAEDKKRRICTAFGYRLGGTNTMMNIMLGLVFVPVVLILLLATMSSRISTDGPIWMSPLFWGCFAPLGLIPLVPLLFLKFKYALGVIGLVLAITVGSLAVSGFAIEVQNWVVGQLIN